MLVDIIKYQIILKAISYQNKPKHLLVIQEVNQPSLFKQVKLIIINKGILILKITIIDKNNDRFVLLNDLISNNYGFIILIYLL